MAVIAARKRVLQIDPNWARKRLEKLKAESPTTDYEQKLVDERATRRYNFHNINDDRLDFARAHHKVVLKPIETANEALVVRESNVSDSSEEEEPQMQQSHYLHTTNMSSPSSTFGSAYKRMRTDLGN